MGRNNQHRQARRRSSRDHSGTGRPRSPSALVGPDTTPGPQAAGPAAALHRERARKSLLDLVIFGLAAPDGLETVVGRTIIERSAEWGTDVLDEVLTAMLLEGLGAMYEHGWQPLDLVHLARRSDHRLAPVAALAVLRHAAVTGAKERAPRLWLDQLEAAADVAGDGVEDRIVEPSSGRWTVVDTLVTGGVEPLRAWCDVLRVMGALQGHLPLERLVPPPSAWGRAAPPRTGAVGSDRARILNRIRGLLAKAEATTFVAEAEAFTAKAQDLMTRHAIEDAFLHAADDEPVTVLGVRVHLDSPYAGEKAHLLNAVAGANRVRLVFDSRRAIATIVGTPIDVDQVEMLFASLLIQATRSMAQAGSADHAGSSDRSPSFRRAFLIAYASRLGERLADADREATVSYGAALVPVLARHDAAVDAEYDRLFPETRRTPSRAVNARGWQAGRLAADQAVIVAGRLSP